MEPNVYAAPVAETNPDAGPVRHLPGEPQPWTIGDAFRGALRALERDWPGLLAANLVYVLGLFLMAIVVARGCHASGLACGEDHNLALMHAFKDGDTSQMRAIVMEILRGVAESALINLALSSFLHAGMIRVAVASVRGDRVHIGLLFSATSRHAHYFVAAIVSAVLTYVGFALLIVPGVFAVSISMYATYFASDTDLGPIECLAATWRASRGRRFDLVLFMLASVAIGVAGVLACLVGVVVAYPVVMLAAAIVYTRISGRTAGADTARPMLETA